MLKNNFRLLTYQSPFVHTHTHTHTHTHLFVFWVVFLAGHVSKGMIIN